MDNPDGSLSPMPTRHILSPQSRAALFDPPTDPAAIVRHYTFSSEDLALVRARRRAANRLGFGVHLAFLRFPGRVIGVDGCGGQFRTRKKLAFNYVGDRASSALPRIAH